MKILVVDDEKMTLLAIAKKLAEKNYEVITTSNGVEALNIISEKDIDLIISDIMMPSITGYALLTMLKNFYFSKIPLILMSGFPPDAIQLNLYGVGAESFIKKPIDFNALYKKIDEISHRA